VERGFFLPNLGGAASPANLVAVAQRAEALGFDSVWVTDRLLSPVHPTAPWRGAPDGRYPEAYRTSLDPLTALTFVAGATSRVRLGTSILNVNYHHPVVVGRALTTLDVVSGGRLVLGVGIGWHPDEFTAVGVDMRTRGRRADEFLSVLTAIWTQNPVAFAGEFFTLPESSILPKPVQRPHPPILFAATSEAALARAVRFDAGIHPVNPTPAELAALVLRYRQLMAEAGRDPATRAVSVRVEYEVTERPLPGDRALYHGDLQQLADDVAGIRDAGATEVVFDPSYFVHSIEAFTEHLEFLATLEP
jgi:probable F420-dependent oxidoreductase